MPKYLVTSGSHFTPFTYDELVKPVAHMQQAHDAAQDAYDTLNLETSALQRYITDNPGDSKAKAMYDNYMEKLSTLQNNLWEKGYNAQTRRDLAAARGAYASDITRLATAIKNRQERSKEYWDAKHKNPDLIMSEDPALGGLDKYLEDENYGHDYYTYDGKTLMEKVGIDAKARASELLRTEDVKRDPQMQWILRRIEHSGFTSAEVAAASTAVRAALGGDSSMLQTLDEPSMILAGVLMSNVNSTGAYGKVSKEEFNRLIDYGTQGLSQAIGKASDKDYEDPYFKQQMELDTYRRKKGIDKAAADQPDGGWEPVADFARFQQEHTGKVESELGDTYYKGYRDDAGNMTPQPIRDSDGNVVGFVSNAMEAGYVANNTEGRTLAQRELDGLDVALNIRHRKSKQQISDNGKYRADTRFPSGDEAKIKEALRQSNFGTKDLVAVYTKDENGNLTKFDYDATLVYNKAKQIHDRQFEEFKSTNPDLNLFGPNEARELRKKYSHRDDINLTNVPDYDLETAIKRKYAKDMWMRVPDYVSSSDRMDDVRENAARSINSFVNGFTAAGKDGKSTAAIFYPVVNGGYDVSSVGMTAEDIFEYKNGRIDPSCIDKIYVLPEDVIGKGQGPMVRIQTSKPVTDNKGKTIRHGITALVSARALGDLYNVLSRGDIQSQFVNLLDPVISPDKYLGSDDAYSSQWASDMMRLGYAANLEPAKNIIRDDEKWNNYYGMLTQYLQNILGKSIDLTTFSARQSIGKTSAKAAGYRIQK